MHYYVSWSSFQRGFPRIALVIDSREFSRAVADDGKLSVEHRVKSDDLSQRQLVLGILVMTR